MHTIVAYIVRHGTTEMNQQNVFRGDADPNLDKQGWNDARQLAYYFKPIDIFPKIFSSDKLRAFHTAKAIADRKDSVEVCSNEGLRPWDIGDFAGQEKNQANMDKLQLYVKNPHVPPPNGEPLLDARARVIPLVREAIEIADLSGLPAVMVVHSSVLHIIGEAYTNDLEAGHVKPGGVAAIYYDGRTLGVTPIFKADARAKTQNVLGTKLSGGFS